MANTFEKTNPIKRDTEISGYPLRLIIDGNGVQFYRKGDRRREKPHIDISWDEILAAAAHVAEDKGELTDGNIDKHLGFKTTFERDD